MEIEAIIPLITIKFNKMCKIYALRILKIQKIYLIRKLLYPVFNRTNKKSLRINFVESKIIKKP